MHPVLRAVLLFAALIGVFVALRTGACGDLGGRLASLTVASREATPTERSAVLTLADLASHADRLTPADAARDLDDDRIVATTRSGRLPWLAHEGRAGGVSLEHHVARETTEADAEAWLAAEGGEAARAAGWQLEPQEPLLVPVAHTWWWSPDGAPPALVVEARKGSRWYTLRLQGVRPADRAAAEALLAPSLTSFAALPW